MNTILLRTDRGEYFPGETICGAVYLLIQTPTEAHGVQLSFNGREAVTCECDIDGNKTTLKASHDYVDYSNTDIFIQEEPFALGSYCFPFRLQLPFVIPGTFHACSNNPVKVWSACVSFTLKTSVLGTDAMTAEQDVVVNGTEQQSITENHMTKAHEISIGSTIAALLGLNVHVTVKPLANFVRTGSNACLRMIVTNRPKASRFFFILRSFVVQLVRTLTLRIPYRPHRNTEAGGDQPASNDSVDSDKAHCKIVQVEGERTVVREMRGDLSQNSSFTFSSGGGLDNLMIPLKDANGHNVFPSVSGRYIQCDYFLEVSLQVGDRTETVKCPIPGILPEENVQWQSWTTMPWMQTSQVKLSRIPTPLTPPEQILDSEAFGRLPPFQVL